MWLDQLTIAIVEKDINKGETREFKLFVEPFTYSKDYNISIGARCRWHYLTTGIIYL